jgi:hypothetical protein
MDSSLALRMTDILLHASPLIPLKEWELTIAKKKRRQAWRLYKKGGETPPLQITLKT